MGLVASQDHSVGRTSPMDITLGRLPASLIEGQPAARFCLLACLRVSYRTWQTSSMISRFREMGFSQKIAFPARDASMIWLACCGMQVRGGVE